MERLLPLLACVAGCAHLSVPTCVGTYHWPADLSLDAAAQPELRLHSDGTFDIGLAETTPLLYGTWSVRGPALVLHGALEGTKLWPSDEQDGFGRLVWSRAALGGCHPATAWEPRDVSERLPTHAELCRIEVTVE